MMNASRFCAVAVAAAIIAIACGPAFADPLPNEVLKFYQTPLNNGLAVYPPGAFPNPGDFAAPFPGHDEWSTATQIAPGQYQGYYMADDFSDNYSTPIAHVMWWGSYQNNLRDGGAQKFLITFESDVPVGPGNPLGYSHPGSVISSQIVTLGPLAPQSGTFTETPVVPGPLGPPSPDGTLWQYNAELALSGARSGRTSGVDQDRGPERQSERAMDVGMARSRLWHPRSTGFAGACAG